jgi:hypothetical protein
VVTLRRSLVYFGWNLLVSAAITFASAGLLRGMFQVLGKFAMKVAEYIPGLRFLDKIGYFIQRTLGDSGAGRHVGGGMGWLQKIFGV